MEGFRGGRKGSIKKQEQKTAPPPERAVPLGFLYLPFSAESQESRMFQRCQWLTLQFDDSTSPKEEGSLLPEHPLWEGAAPSPGVPG